MILCIDIGNTNLAIGLVKEKKILETYRLATNSLLTEDEYIVKFKDIITHSKYGHDEIKGVIIASVVPLMDGIMTKVFNKYFNLKPIFVGPGIKSGIHIKIENPKQLGADILIGAVGAYDKYQGNIIIVDLGTATKLFIVTSSGEMIGGIIAPGVLTSLDALVSSTAKLQRTSLEIPENIIGRDTVSSIQSGSVYGTASMIDGLIKKIKKEIGDATVVLTGGLADLFHKVIETDHFYEPNILLEGLIILYYKNI